MKDVLQPAIGYAREGFPVSELIAYYWGRSAGLKRYPGFADTFLVDGKAPTKGQIFKNPKLANTLEQIANGGRDAFYKGEIARTIAAFMKKHGGYVSYEDLATHRSEWVEPVSVDYHGYRLWELPPNGQGIAALQILGVLKGYDLKAMGFGSADHVHYFTEAKKLAFEDRARFYADPDFSDVPVGRLISDEYSNERRKLINPRRSARRLDAGPVEGDTIYLTVADKDRNMISLIQSNYRGMDRECARMDLVFVCRDRGELFDMTPGRPNSYAPGKRPFHTIIPAFVTKGEKPFLSFGVMGGATQPQGHAQVLINIADFGMNFQEAGDAPRMLHTGSSQPTGEKMTDGGTLTLETGYDYNAIRELMLRGHKVGYNSGSYGGYQGIGYDAENDVYLGASESRKDGQAAGY